MPIISFRILAMTLTLGAMTPALAQQVSQAEPADKLYFGGPIVTMYDANLFVEAVATRDGDILATGRLRDLEQLAGDDTIRVDLDGRTLMPNASQLSLFSIS